MTIKLIIFLFRRSDLSRKEFLTQWGDERFTSIGKKIPGLKQWVQNHVISEEEERMPDGIADMWFEDTEALRAALDSAEFGATREAARSFLDPARSVAVVVEEKIVLDLNQAGLPPAR